jgi:hypothetical protein
MRCMKQRWHTVTSAWISWNHSAQLPSQATSGETMSDAVIEYEKLVKLLNGAKGVTASQMFGKPCLKVNGKAFVAQHKETVVFKLNSPQHEKACSLAGAKLWDPSGKGRPMKEWVAIPATENKNFKTFANSALLYVSSNA